MKTPFAILFCLALMVGLSFSWGQRSGSQPNTLASVPMQVMGEGRLTNLAVGTGLKFMLGTTNTLSNSFAGYWKTNATWILYTNGGTASGTTGAPVVVTMTARERLDGFYQPTVSIPTDENAKIWYGNYARGSNDIAPQCTFKSGLEPSVVVAGFSLMISNWAPEGSLSTFRGFDTFRIGQAPYAICQIGDNTESDGKMVIRVHTADPPQTGGNVVILDNGEVYEVVMLYDNPQDVAKLRVYQKLPSGQWSFKGESSFIMTTAGGSSAVAENVFFHVHDDHSGWGLSTSVGGDIYLGHYWMTTNREDYYNAWFPRY